MRGSRLLAGLLTAGLVLAGCATTRTASMGVLPNHEHLVTLLVTQDRTLIEERCRGALAIGPILGCQSMRSTTLPDGQDVRLITIVRFTDSVPSPMAFEIDLHELCHAVATLQGVNDPCHVGNDGLLQTGPRALLHAR